MSTIAVGFTNLGVPATGLSPTIRIRRTDTQALVVTDSPMTEQGDGSYSFDFAPVDGLEYAIRADGTATLPDAERYAFGSVSGTTEARLETDIPDILADTAAMEPLVDVATSTRAAPGDAMDLVTDAVDAAALATDGLQELADHLETAGTNPHGTGSWETFAGGGGLTAQQTRDAMKLAPTGGAPAAGSIDADLDTIEASTTGGGAGPWTTATGFATTADVATILAAIAALADPTAAEIADAVWTEVLAAHETVSGSAAEAVAALRNRIRIDYTAGPPVELVVYAQDGVAELYRSPLTTTNGAAVLAFFGVQHERGVPV